MRFSRSIAEYGTSAVREYCKISGIKNDNEIPEVFLGGWIARSLHSDFQVNTRIEFSFTQIASDLGEKIDPALKNIMGSWRADVAIYENEKPTGIIEIKIYDEGCHPHKILHDLEKMREISKRKIVETYLAVLITPTSRESSEERIKKLTGLLGGSFDYIDSPIIAGGGTSNWSWQFACGSFT